MTTTPDTALYCYVHPDRPTSLRCNRCERPICTEDAVRTPTGYRCRNCVREQQRVFDTAVWSDFVLVFPISAVLSGLATIAISIVGSFLWFFVLGLGPLAGVLIANVIRRVVKNRRSRALNFTLLGGIFAGSLPMLFLQGLGSVLGLLGSDQNPLAAFSLFPLLIQVVYLVTALPAAYSQFSGLVFRR